MNKNLFIIGGCSCSGKSTVARMLCEKNRFIYWRSDKIIKEIESYHGGSSLDKVKTLYYRVLKTPASPPEKSLMMANMYHAMAEYVFSFLDKLTDNIIIAEGVSFLPEIVSEYAVPKENYIALSIGIDKRYEIFQERNYVKKHFPKDSHSFFETVCIIDNNYQKQCEKYGYEYYVNQSAETTYEHILQKIKATNKFQQRRQ